MLVDKEKINFRSYICSSTYELTLHRTENCGLTGGYVTLSPGLQVRVSNKNSPQKPRKTSFDFVWAPFHQIPRAVAWQRLALHGTTFSHLRLHNLSDSDDLGDFLTLMSSIPSTLALVLVNTASHYRSGTVQHTVRQSLIQL